MTYRLRSIGAIAKTTIIEQIRNRLYLVIWFFGGALLVASMLLGALAPGQKVRVIFDLGLVTLELFGLTTAVFGAVSLVLQETESKTIYLILTRPVSRSTYILGRYVGLIAAVALTMAAMAALHLGVMLFDREGFREFAYGWPFWGTYPVLLLMVGAKMLVTAAIALFFSLFASSQVSSLVFTGSFWIAGHFGSEIHFLIDRSVHGGVIRNIAKAIFAILPNYQYFNYRDTFTAPGASFSSVPFALIYGLSYTGFLLALSILWFSRKEF